MSKEIFALDIGTRKVMGIVAQLKDEYLEILDVDVIEHPHRPMFDAQIHSIEEVAKTVRQIKRNLESRLHKKLNKVGVAVAGRNLITFRGKVTKEFSYREELGPQEVRNLELEAIDRIISDSNKNLSEFHCVGYSPLYYELDGNRISNPIGHQARRVCVEVIATFLPRIALDSIFAVLERAGLELISVTLEPIAAINAVIPPDMRHLNILLVDVGAGTSDLALSKDGVVFAFGMVPEAGDEITETICENLLVDFNTGERIKRSLLTAQEIEYEDIWRKKHVVTAEKVKEVCALRVKEIADSIAKLALELNAGIPRAVVGVGGGSLTYNLINELAVSLGIPLDKAGIRKPDAIKWLKDNTHKLTGPESITPIGIAMMTAQAKGLRFIDIQVNGKKLKMLDFHQKKDVLGALVLSGIDNKKLYPRCGLALTVKVNGELRTIKGTMGEPAKITLNGKPVTSLSCQIDSGDVIEFIEAKNGQDAYALVGDLVELKPIRIIFNGEPLEILPTVTMNGEKVSLDTPVVDRATIQTHNLNIREILLSKGFDLDNLLERQILVNINNQPRILTQRNFTLKLNGKTANLDTEVKDKDSIEFFADRPTFYRIKDVVDIPTTPQKMCVNVDGKDIEIELEPVQIFMNGRQVEPEEFLIDGADIRVYLKEKKIFLSEIFRYIDIDPNVLKGKRMKIFVGDQPAGFTTPLVDGSKVRILFEELDKEV